MKDIKLDHPCKQTCSGWKQGFERGVSAAIKVVEDFAIGGNIYSYPALSEQLELLLEELTK